MAADVKYQTHEYDVLVIGAGGAGLRAAIGASAQGARTALVCKSLLGKAHTVMAEGGMAAAMGNVWKEDNWQVHFRDTMRGGKMLNNWRMAQLHAQESPDAANAPEASTSRNRLTPSATFSISATRTRRDADAVIGMAPALGFRLGPLRRRSRR